MPNASLWPALSISLVYALEATTSTPVERCDWLSANPDAMPIAEERRGRANGVANANVTFTPVLAPVAEN